jgi:protein involved in polysaccharide export with SLBB domain
MQPERLPGQPGAGDMAMTQRVIRVPTNKIAMGDARYNIIVRPGDVIRVPPPPSGTIYINGQVARVGAYQMAEGLTLTRAITSAGGLSSIAVPERVDIVRMVGPERQGFVRVNLRAIEEGTHPDVFLRGNDRVNVGTNFWATPLAVIRNGFRASYGFGFIADRNFGSDIFGVPPESRARGF